MEADENGVTAKNTYGGPLLLRTVFGEEETTYEYLYNAHGDVVTLLSGGEVVATYYYDSFGNVLEQTGNVDNSILYAGYQYDEETGLYYINARMYDPVTARFLQADTYLGSLNDPLSLNLYTYCLNNPHKYTDPSGHIPLLLIGVALLVGAVSAQAEYKRQVREGDNYTNLVSIGVVGISNTLLCLIPGGKAVSAYKMATAGGSFVLKTFAVQFGKAVGLGVAAGYATDAGIEVTRQLATGTKLSNLEYDRINEAGVTGAIAGGAGAIFGAGVEALANTRVGQSVAAKFNQAVSKGKNAIKNGFAKVAGKSGKTATEVAETVVNASSKTNDEARKILGPYYDVLIEKNKQNPAYYAYPDSYRIVEGDELIRNRADYTSMVNHGELEPGHHILGIADGGKNVQSNITHTGEKFLTRDMLPQSALDYYDSIYGKPNNPHPKRIAIYEQNGIIRFGKNPQHTAATTLQQEIHNWQKKNGYRR